MKSVGDAAAGFSVSYDAELGAVRVRGWGFWGVDVAQEFTRTVSDVCLVSPRGVGLLLDMSDLKPLREEGQRSFGALIGMLRELRVGRTTVVTASHLTKLQLLRIVAERDAKDAVVFAGQDAGFSRAG